MEGGTIIERFRKEMSDNIRYSSGSPFLFVRPSCGTCMHWWIVDERALDELATFVSPDDAVRIAAGIRGEVKGVEGDKGEIVDAYRKNTFHGFCKKNPPSPQGGVSIFEFKFFLKFRIKQIPKRVANRWDWPLTPHDEFCGGWDKGDWVDDFLKDNGWDPVTKKWIRKEDRPQPPEG